MSDQSPPPKPKPGSLRDRIAAFEKPSSAPPAPRPKPGAVSWKPKVQSPPASPRLSVDHGDTPEKKVLGGMSAFDAKESIGKGGSLKERMAALQGKGGFGAPPPLAPKPALEKPKWKPPPAVSPPSDDEKLEPEAEQTADRSDNAPPLVESAAESAADHIPQDTHDDGPNLTVEDDDPEEQERQRRAAIAARMARLGGARVGMAPPVFGNKPSIKRTETPKEDTSNEEVSRHLGTVTSDGDSSAKPPPVEQTSDVTEAEQIPDSFPARQNSASSSVLSAESTSSTPGGRTPSSMPVPAGPRRAAPPRKKVVKSAPVPEPQTLETDAQGTASADSSQDHDGESQKGTHEKSVAEPSVEADNTHPKVIEEAAHVTEEPQSVDILKPEKSHADTNPAEPLEKPPWEASVDVETGTGAHSVGSRGLQLDNESQASSDSAPVIPGAAEALTAEPEEEDEAARRKRVSERLAKMGAFNPFSAPRRQSSIIEEGPIVSGEAPSPSHSPDIPRRGSLRKESYDSVASKTHWLERVELRKSSLDLDTDRPNVPPPPPRAEDLRTSSMDSTLSSPPLSPVASDLTKPTSTPIEIESPAQTDSTEYIVSKEEDESQDEFKGLGDEHDVAMPYDEHESHEQHKADEETLQGVVEHGREHESSNVADSYEWEGNDAESEYSNDDPPSDANQGPSHDRTEDREIDTSFSQITRVPPPRPTANTQPNIVIVHGESSPPSIVSHASARSSVSLAPSVAPSQEYKGQQVDKGPTASRPVPLPRIISDEEFVLESETEPIRPNRSLLPPTRILPHTPEDDYQSESEPKPVPLPRSSRMALLPRPAPYQSEENSPTDIESGAAPRLHRFIPPPSMDEGQNLLNDDASSLEAEESWDVEEAEEEILPTPPPRRSLQPSHVPTTRKTTLDYEAEELMATISAPSVRGALPESQQLPVHEPSPYRTLPSVSVEGHEVLDESEGDPIDPAFHSPSRRGSPVNTPPHPILPLAPELTVETEEDSERARRRTIADRMAKLGGIKFGASLPLGRPPVQHIEDNTPDHPIPAEEEASPEAVQTEEDEEVARKQRIAAKLSSMGGQRFGILPLGPSGAIPRPKRPESGISSGPPPASLRAAPPSKPAPPPQDTDSEHDSIPSEDGVRVEAEEESELEEVNHEDAQDEEETPPPLPTRAGRSSGSESRTEQPRKMSYPPVAGGRPPVPAIPPNFLNRRSSIQSTAPTTRVSVGSGSSHHQSPSSSLTARPPSFVMVDEPGSFEQEEEAPPPPPARPTSRVPPSRGAPPSASNSTDVTASQWELPSIPASSIDFGDGSVDLSLSSWTEVAPSAPSSKPTSSSGGQRPVASSKAPPVDAQLSADDLIAVWGRVGVQICEVATTLHEKSRKSLVGDGSYHGFVDAVLSQVPNAALPSPPSYGYVVYVQVGSAVQKRASEIMPGDIVMFSDAKFKGHKGIQIYHQNVGAEETLVGIVNEFEPKKSKIKVFEANQHVGQQTVESVSYRLEDMKSGTVKIFRVLEA